MNGREDQSISHCLWLTEIGISCTISYMEWCMFVPMSEGGVPPKAANCECLVSVKPLPVTNCEGINTSCFEHLGCRDTAELA